MYAHTCTHVRVHICIHTCYICIYGQVAEPQNVQHKAAETPDPNCKRYESPELFKEETAIPSLPCRRLMNIICFCTCQY